MLRTSSAAGQSSAGAGSPRSATIIARASISRWRKVFCPIGRHYRGTACIVLAALLCSAADAAERSRTVRAQFMRDNPCPSTGKTRGPCPGFEADHARSLCSGGADHPSNLVWRRIDEHRKKTRDDVAFCRGRKYWP